MYQPKTITKKQMDPNEKYLVYGANGVIGRYHEYNHADDQLILGCRGSCGTVHIAYGPSWITGNAMVVRPRIESIRMDFLSYYFMGGIDLSSVITGAAQPQITRKSLNPVLFRYPPLPEQERIVAILDEAFEAIDTAIANTEKNLVNARELFESYLNQVLMDVASKTPIQSLSSLTELIVDCLHKTAPTQDTGIPSIRTPNIGKGSLLLDGVKRVSEETYKLWSRRAEPQPGDLIMAREAPAGNVGVIPPGKKVCLGQRTLLIRPDTQKVHSTFLAYLLLHPTIQKRLLSHSKGATVQHVNMKDIRMLPLSALPAIEEQQRLADRIQSSATAIEQLESVCVSKLDGMESLKQSILQKAFSGELTASAEPMLQEAGL
jgi:type I restriction enzyme S subunit